MPVLLLVDAISTIRPMDDPSSMNFEKDTCKKTTSKTRRLRSWKKNSINTFACNFVSSLCVMDRTVKVSMCSLLVSQRETNIISFKRKKRNRAQSEQAPNCLRIVKTYDYHIVFIWSFYWWQIQTDRLLAFGGKVPSARYLGLI